jgi:hypothetical protein
MKPAQASSYLYKIATSIERSKFPKLNLVLEDIRMLLAALWRPMRYFAFPTNSKSAHLEDPIYLEDMLDRVKDDYTLAMIYGDIVGIHVGEDFSWVIGIEENNDEVIEELEDLDIAYEIPEARVQFLEDINPIEIWWESYGDKMPEAEMARLSEHNLPDDEMWEAAN